MPAVKIKTSQLAFALFISFLLVSASSAQDGWQRPEVANLPIPDYPEAAKRSGLAGKVTVLVSIDENGRVTSVDSVTGPDWVCPSVTRADVVALRNAAGDAAMKATFTPASKNGKPQKSTWQLNYQFGKTGAAVKNDLNYSAATVGEKNDGSNGKVYQITGIEKDKARQADEPKIVSDTVVNGKATNLAKPSYPGAALAVGATGSVDVQVLIDTDGSVFSAESISGHPLLRFSARTAACRSRFKPTLLAGEPVRVSGIITYNFVK